jgi:hypothetical protein
VLMAVAAVPANAAEDMLKICLDEILPPLSVHRHGIPDSGFDVTLAQAVAAQLGRPLQIQQFESKPDEDSSPELEANALPSDVRCSLVGSYALTDDSLAAPGVKTAELPISRAVPGPITGGGCRSACSSRAGPRSIRR